MMKPIFDSMLRSVSRPASVSPAPFRDTQPQKIEFLSSVQMAVADAPLALHQPEGILLNFDDLNNFEVVQDQFQQWGIRFHNAIAIRPSNPAFPPHSGQTVLMSAPRSGWLEVEFQGPVRVVAGYITSSQRARIIAVDDQSRILAETQLACANLADPHSELAPNFYLNLQVPGTHRVIFHALGGQLTLDDLSFCA